MKYTAILVSYVILLILITFSALVLFPLVIKVNEIDREAIYMTQNAKQAIKNLSERYQEDNGSMPPKRLPSMEKRDMQGTEG